LRLGAHKIESGAMTMLIEPRVAGRFLGYLLGPMNAQSIQQKRSFYDGKIGQVVASKELTIVDDPLMPRGLGSRRYDGEGIAAKVMPVIEAGVLRNVYADTYYGRKAKLPITTGGTSNLVFGAGKKGLSELLAQVKEGILVTNFLGGNSNETTGDFSLGVAGVRIRRGERAEPVSEMNIAGNHLAVWKQLVAVGNDPYVYASYRTPTMVFENIQFAGK
jgi:PmbA protein